MNKVPDGVIPHSSGAMDARAGRLYESQILKSPLEREDPRSSESREDSFYKFASWVFFKDDFSRSGLGFSRVLFEVFFWGFVSFLWCSWESSKLMSWDSYIKEFDTTYSREFSSVESEGYYVEFQKAFDTLRSR